MDSPALKYESQWTIKGFNDKFDELIKDTDTYNSYIKAYAKAEEDHFKLFGKYRYKSYDAFRDSRRAYIFKMGEFRAQ